MNKQIKVFAVGAVGTVGAAVMWAIISTSAGPVPQKVTSNQLSPEEAQAKERLEHFGAVSQSVVDQCTTPDLVGSYAKVLACIQVSLAKKPEPPVDDEQIADDEQIHEPALKKGMARLYSDYGCNTYEVQVARLTAMKYVFQAAALKAQGAETSDSIAVGALMSKKMAKISSTQCRELYGDFKVLERRSIAGGHATKIRFDKSTTLWVLAD